MRERETDSVESALQILSGTEGEKDQEKGQAQDMNIPGVVALAPFKARNIAHKWRFFVAR